MEDNDVTNAKVHNKELNDNKKRDYSSREEEYNDDEKERNRKYLNIEYDDQDYVNEEQKRFNLLVQQKLLDPFTFDEATNYDNDDIKTNNPLFATNNNNNNPFFEDNFVINNNNVTNKDVNEETLIQDIDNELSRSVTMTLPPSLPPFPAKLNKMQKKLIHSNDLISFDTPSSSNSMEEESNDLKSIREDEQEYLINKSHEFEKEKEPKTPNETKVKDFFTKLVNTSDDELEEEKKSQVPNVTSKVRDFFKNLVDDSNDELEKEIKSQIPNETKPKEVKDFFKQLMDTNDDEFEKEKKQQIQNERVDFFTENEPKKIFANNDIIIKEIDIGDNKHQNDGNNEASNFNFNNQNDPEIQENIFGSNQLNEFNEINNDYFNKQQPPEQKQQNFFEFLNQSEDLNKPQGSLIFQYLDEEENKYQSKQQKFDSSKVKETYDSLENEIFNDVEFSAFIENNNNKIISNNSEDDTAEINMRNYLKELETNPSQEMEEFEEERPDHCVFRCESFTINPTKRTTNERPRIARQSTYPGSSATIYEIIPEEENVEKDVSEDAENETSNDPVYFDQIAKKLKIEPIMSSASSSNAKNPNADPNATAPSTSTGGNRSPPTSSFYQNNPGQNQRRNSNQNNQNRQQQQHKRNNMQQANRYNNQYNNNQNFKPYINQQQQQQQSNPLSTATNLSYHNNNNFTSSSNKYPAKQNNNRNYNNKNYNRQQQQPLKKDETKENLNSDSPSSQPPPLIITESVESVSMPMSMSLDHLPSLKNTLGDEDKDYLTTNKNKLKPMTHSYSASSPINEQQSGAIIQQNYFNKNNKEEEEENDGDDEEPIPFSPFPKVTIVSHGIEDKLESINMSLSSSETSSSDNSNSSSSDTSSSLSSGVNSHQHRVNSGGFETTTSDASHMMVTASEGEASSFFGDSTVENTITNGAAIEEHLKNEKEEDIKEQSPKSKEEVVSDIQKEEKIAPVPEIQKEEMAPVSEIQKEEVVLNKQIENNETKEDDNNQIQSPVKIIVEEIEDEEEMKSPPSSSFSSEELQNSDENNKEEGAAEVEEEMKSISSEKLIIDLELEQEENNKQEDVKLLNKEEEEKKAPLMAEEDIFSNESNISSTSPDEEEEVAPVSDNSPEDENKKKKEIKLETEEEEDEVNISNLSEENMPSCFSSSDNVEALASGNELNNEIMTRTTETEAMWPPAPTPTDQEELAVVNDNKLMSSSTESLKQELNNQLSQMINDQLSDELLTLINKEKEEQEHKEAVSNLVDHILTDLIDQVIQTETEKEELKKKEVQIIDKEVIDEEEELRQKEEEMKQKEQEMILIKAENEKNLKEFLNDLQNNIHVNRASLTLEQEEEDRLRQLKMIIVDQEHPQEELMLNSSEEKLKILLAAMKDEEDVEFRPINEIVTNVDDLEEEEEDIVEVKFQMKNSNDHHLMNGTAEAINVTLPNTSTLSENNDQTTCVGENTIVASATASKYDKDISTISQGVADKTTRMSMDNTLSSVTNKSTLSQRKKQNAGGSIVDCFSCSIL